jgi:hypothetical protein
MAKIDITKTELNSGDTILNSFGIPGTPYSIRSATGRGEQEYRRIPE